MSFTSTFASSVTSSPNTVDPMEEFDPTQESPVVRKMKTILAVSPDHISGNDMLKQVIEEIYERPRIRFPAGEKDNVFWSIIEQIRAQRYVLTKRNFNALLRNTMADYRVSHHYHSIPAIREIKTVLAVSPDHISGNDMLKRVIEEIYERPRRRFPAEEDEKDHVFWLIINKIRAQRYILTERNFNALLRNTMANFRRVKHHYNLRSLEPVE